MISAIILTFNEEKHIKRCIDSVLTVVDHIYIMDSYSTDSTLDVVREYPRVSVKKNKFINHAIQLNHALDAFDITSEWVIRIDADEFIDKDLQNFLLNDLSSIPNDIDGVLINRLLTFMGKLLIHGGMEQYWIMRLWRNGKAKCEQSWMDEHMILTSDCTKFVKAKGRLIDDNLNNLSWWAHKHVDYSTREAISIIQKELNEEHSLIKPKLFGNATERSRFFKYIYNLVPLFVRPFIYFLYRYIIRMGFLDKKQGFLWAVLQGFWYRLMVDAKVFELKSQVSVDKDIKQIIKEKYKYEV